MKYKPDDFEDAMICGHQSDTDQGMRMWSDEYDWVYYITYGENVR